MKSLAAAFAILSILPIQAKELQYTVSNTLPFPRKEVVEVPVGIPNESIVPTVLDSTGNPVPSQPGEPGKLLFLASVPAKGKSTYTVSYTSRTPHSGSQTPNPKTCTSFTRPDCQDDIAWENDRCGYRLYGPLFRNGGGKVHGYDIWSKSVDYPVVSKFYDDDKKRGISYHKDHGEGFDGYTVGPTVGAGMAALVLGDSICYPTAYESVEILEEGPVRTSFLIRCYPENICGETMRETRRITLDAGSSLNKVEVVWEGAPEADKVIAGIVVHKDNPEGYRILPSKGIVSVCDLTDNLADNNGTIYVGMYVPEKAKGLFRTFPEVKANAVGEACLEIDRPVDAFTYYWGSDWTKHGIQSEAQWLEILEHARLSVIYPLEVVGCGL